MVVTSEATLCEYNLNIEVRWVMICDGIIDCIMNNQGKSSDN